MIEIGKAVYETRDKINLDKLISYLIQNESQVAIKRYLYLCDLLSVEWTAHHESLIQNIGSSFSLLDTTGPDQGRKNSKFRLKINIDADSIRNSIFT
jgi:predicted transcriptional regulator of viral defense system